jgi:type II secretory pathway pseudopilin PulG
MKCRAYTLIEMLLVTVLLMFFSTACILSVGFNTNHTTIKTKIENYKTLTRFIKANSSLSGIPISILTVSNKLILSTNIPTVQLQIDELNDNLIVLNNETNPIVTYFPDGSIEGGDTLNIEFENEVAYVTINDWNVVDVVLMKKI